MTLDEAIKRYTSNAFYEKSDGNLQGCLEFNQLAEWLKDYKRLLKQETVSKESYEHEYFLRKEFEIKIAKLEQEPKTGHWIKIFLTDTSDIDGQCSECGFIHKFIDGHTAQYNYCPNCGARMAESEDKE